MLRATPGCRRIRPARSSVSTIWWTEGGVTRKRRCRSASAGGRPMHQGVGVDEGQVLPLLGCEAGRGRRATRPGHLIHLLALNRWGTAMNVRYRVELSEAERAQLTALLSGGKHAARKLKRAQILLAADAGASDAAIASSVAVGGSTVYRTKRRFVRRQPGAGAERGAAPRRGAQALRQGGGAAGGDRLLQPARGAHALDAGAAGRRDGQADRARRPVARDGAPAPGRERSEALAQGDVVHSARSTATMSPAWRTCSISMPKPPDPKRPVVCFDESPTQLIGEVRQPIPAKPGQLERYDCEYRRNGTVNLFVFLDAHRPWRKVKVTEQRTARDFAHCMRDLVDSPLSAGRADPRRARQPVDPLRRRAVRDLPGARGAPHPAPPGVPLHPQARQLAQHGRDRDRRAARPVPRPPHRRARRLNAEITAWERQRNAAGARISWMFTTNGHGQNDARLSGHRQRS